MVTQKKFIFSLVFFLLFIKLFSFVYAQEDFKEKIDEKIYNLEREAENLKELSREENKWNYISNEIKKYLLRNALIKETDEFLSKISIVFFIFFGRHYSLSISFFITIFSWFFFFFQFKKIFESFSSFGEGTSLIVSLCLVIISAHSIPFDIIFQKLFDFIFKLIFFREGVWGIFGSIISFVLIILILIFINNFLSAFKKEFLRLKKEEEERSKKLEENIHLSRIKMISEAIANALKGKNS